MTVNFMGICLSAETSYHARPTRDYTLAIYFQIIQRLTLSSPMFTEVTDITRKFPGITGELP